MCLSRYLIKLVKLLVKIILTRSAKIAKVELVHDIELYKYFYYILDLTLLLFLK